MLLILVLGVTLLTGSYVSSASIQNNQAPAITQYVYDTSNLPNSYQYHYDTADGSSRAEHGEMLNPGTPDAALDVKGAVRWYDSKGHLYEMFYKAGKRGYNTIIRKVPTS